MRRAVCAVVLLVALPNAARAQPAAPDADPRIQQIVASVSEARLRQLTASLVGFGTRETLSATTSSSRGIGAARQWIADELRRSSPRLQVSFDSHRIAAQGRVTRPVELWNVMAVLPGRTARRVYVSGHYDSVNLGSQESLVTTPGTTNPQARADFDHEADAPGANDNGSGTALTMELARVFAESGLSFDATLVFACWAGEEQGLIGSTAHAQALSAAKVTVDAVFNNDIVGNSRGGNGVVDAESVRLYAVGPEDSPSRALARYVARTASIYVPAHTVRLMAREDRFGRGSDQSSFTTRGFAAVVFRESNEDFGRQHSAADTLDAVDFGYLARNARVNAASVAALALAPPAPSVVDAAGRPRLARTPSGYDADLQWTASPGAAGYRIYWRQAWASDWERSQAVGNVTRFVFPGLSIDDVVFGVAAVGTDGQESLVSAFVTPPRTVPDVTLVP